MSHKFDKKSKKSFKSSQRHISLGIPTNIAAGPLGFRAELDIGPKDEKKPRTSRIVFHEKKSEHQGPPVPGTSASGAVIGSDEHGNNTTENTGDTRGEGGSIEVSRVPEQDYKSTVLGASGARVDVQKEAAHGFGPLKDVLGTISAVYTDHEETSTVRNKIEDLLLHIIALEARFAIRPGDVTEQRRRSGLISKLKDIEDQLRSWSEASRPQRPADRVQDDEVVPGLLEDLRETISDYRMVHQMPMYEEGCKLINPAEANVLNNFRSAQDAEYRHGNRRGCLKGTRRVILDEIEFWTRDFDKPPVYWLNGLAGTGKTTIAQTIAERVLVDGQLGASFFCSRDFEDRSNLHFIFPTLAVQLARRYTEFRSIFVPLVQSDPGVASESLYNQMNKLIVQPLAKFGISTVIIIDALDECKDEEPASAILSVLGQFVSEIPKVKFFVTGRPELRIREGFRLPLLVKATNVFVLHEVKPNRVNNDIRLFFKHRFSEIASRRRGLDSWPTQEQLDLLCERAAGLFVHAVATVRFVDHRNNSPKKQLDRLLQSPEISVFEGKTKFKANMTLDSLYTSILQEAFGDDDPEDDPKVRSVLGAVVLAVNPLSPSIIATLLNFDTEDVFPLLSSVHSLLILQEDVDRPVRSFHKSFPDFITDPARCANQRFHVSPPDHHPELLIGCLELMNRRLERNMCKLPDAVTNSEVEDLGERTERYIDQGLRYACRSWHKHLVGRMPSDMLKTKSVLHLFLQRKFLFWLEVLSVLGAAREAVDALDVVAKSLDASPTLNLVNDYFRFVITFFEVISASAPHIYHSALPLSPQTSVIRKLYESYTRPLARVVRGLPISWEPTVATSYHHDRVSTAVWSPCSRFIALTQITSAMVEILDGVTLERLHIGKFSLHGIPWLSFSPDSRSLILLGGRGEVVSWDLQTGGQVSAAHSEPLVPHKLQYFSSTHSMDGKMIAAAYKGSPAVLSTYNLLSGTDTYSHRISEGRIAAPIWTHGQRLRFVTVKPGSATIWEVGFTSMDTLAEVECLSAPDNIGHTGECLFLPNLSRLAFTLQGAVLIWDARDSKLLLNFVSGEGLRGMTFSPDGHFFALGISSQEVHLWKESPTGYIPLQKLVTSTSPFMGPRFSPNGESIITFGPQTTRLWRMADLTSSLSTVPTLFDGQTIFILEFSPDGTLAAVTRQEGNTAVVLDLKSGDPRLIVDADMKIIGLGVTGNTIVVVGGGRVVTWDLSARDCALNARANVNDSVRTTTFDYPKPQYYPLPLFTSISPGFNHIAIVTEGTDEADMSLNVYDVSTRECLASTPTWGEMPWFTPDGREVWCLDGDNGPKGWTIAKDNESYLAKLVPLGPIAHPLGGFPWQSSRGYTVTGNGWVFSPTGKRLLWLPHQWRSVERDRKWSGRFLGLLHGRLPEAVILELDK